MQREIVSTGHRYVQALMNALVLGVQDPKKIEELVNGGMDRVDKITPKDRVRLLELVPKITKQLGFDTPPVPPLSPVQEPEDEFDLPDIGEPSTAPKPDYPKSCADAILDDFLGADTSLDDSLDNDPVQAAISDYLDRAVLALREPVYKERFQIAKKVVGDVPYLLVVSGTLRSDTAEYNIFGTSGNASNFASLDDQYFYCSGGRRVTAQRELDDVGPFSHIVLWGWALPIVKDREFRLWINKRGEKDRARARIRMNLDDPRGYVVLKKHFEK